MADLIPVEANHKAISKPIDRSSEVYVHIRDFLSRENPQSHTRAETAAAIGRLEAAVVSGNEYVLQEIERALRDRDRNPIIPSPVLADAEAEKRLSRLRRSRYFVGVNSPAEARLLVHEVTKGDLAYTSATVRIITLAWCARLIARESPEEAESILAPAFMGREADEIRIARAFVAAARGNHSAALAALSGMPTGLARTASLMIVTWERSSEEAIRWFRTALRSIGELDSDGKLVLLRNYLNAAQWDEALDVASNLLEEDFVLTPALFQTAALAHLAQAVVQELRPFILQHAAFDARNFPLAADDESIRLT